MAVRNSSSTAKIDSSDEVDEDEDNDEAEENEDDGVLLLLSFVSSVDGRFDVLLVPFGDLLTLLLLLLLLLLLVISFGGAFFGLSSCRRAAGGSGRLAAEPYNSIFLRR